jgi:hypothetical protein
MAPSVAADIVKTPAKRGRKPKSADISVPAVTKVQADIQGTIGTLDSVLGNIESLLQRMTACMEILSKSMEILVRDIKKES